MPSFSGKADKIHGLQDDAEGIVQIMGHARAQQREAIHPLGAQQHLLRLFQFPGALHDPVIQLVPGDPDFREQGELVDDQERTHRHESQHGDQEARRGLPDGGQQAACGAEVGQVEQPVLEGTAGFGLVPGAVHGQRAERGERQRDGEDEGEAGGEGDPGRVQRLLGDGPDAGKGPQADGEAQPAQGAFQPPRVIHYLIGDQAAHEGHPEAEGEQKPLVQPGQRCGALPHPQDPEEER